MPLRHSETFSDVIVVSAGDDVMPLGDFLFERSGLSAIVSQRIVPKRQMYWRFG
jgi:hypothetical protein